MANYLLNGLKVIPVIIPVGIYLFFQLLITQNFGQPNPPVFYKATGK